MRYWLSRVFPVPMRSRYLCGPEPYMHTETARWWQWRGRVFFVRTSPGW